MRSIFCLWLPRSPSARPPRRSAYDSGSLLSMQEALGVAFEVGIAAVSDAEFAGHEWQIEGRDVAGRYMEVDVDATTGAVLNVDR